MDNATSLNTSIQEREAMQRLWPQLLKFGVFQLKLYIDVFRGASLAQFLWGHLSLISSNRMKGLIATLEKYFVLVRKRRGRSICSISSALRKEARAQSIASSMMLRKGLDVKLMRRWFC